MHPQPRPFALQLFLDFRAIFFPGWPLIFFVITIHQVIWPSPGTLRMCGSPGSPEFSSSASGKKVPPTPWRFDYGLISYLGSPKPVSIFCEIKPLIHVDDTSRGKQTQQVWGWIQKKKHFARGEHFLMGWGGGGVKSVVWGVYIYIYIYTLPGSQYKVWVVSLDSSG